jgi:hypothetical protein
VKRNIAAASNGKQAAAVVVLGGKPCLWKYAPKSVGEYQNRAALDALIDRAAIKLGYKRDRRCKGHWRKIKGAEI